MDKNLKKQAAAEFDSVLAVLDGYGWKYEAHNSDFEVGFWADGSDMPLQISIKVNPELMLVSALIFMPIEVPEGFEEKFSIAIAVLNEDIVHGGFDFDPLSRQLLFRVSTSYRGSTVDKEVYNYLTGVAFVTVDKVASILKNLCSGELSLTDFAGMMEG